MADAATTETGALDAQRPDAASPADGAAGSDGAADAADAAPGMVSLIVRTVLGSAVVGATVVFDDAAGHVIGTSTTDANGAVQSPLPIGAQATVLLGTAAARGLFTVQGLAPGDAITIVDPVDVPALGYVNVAVATLPSNGPDASLYQALTPGGSGSTVASPPLTVQAIEDYPYYFVGTTLPVVVLAYDPQLHILGYTYQKDVPVDLDAGTAAPTALAPWVTTGASLEFVAIANFDAGVLPSDAGTISMKDHYGAVTSGSFLGSIGVAPTSYSDGGGVLLGFGMYPGFSDYAQAELDYMTYQASPFSISAVSAAAAGPTPAAAAQGQVTVDFSHALPAISGGALTATNPAQPSLAVSTLGALDGADGTIATLTWNAQADASSGPTGEWIIVAPPGTTTIATPSLPAVADSWLPTAASGFTLEGYAAFLVGNGVGYTSFRQNASPYFPYTLGAALPPLSVTGVVSATSWLQ